MYDDNYKHILVIINCMLCLGGLFVFFMFSKLFDFVFFIKFAGFPKDGHKEKGGAAETPKREIRNQHRPSKVEFWETFSRLYKHTFLY